MIISIDSGQSGWSEYVLGRKGDRQGAVLIKGDPELGDIICQSTDYNTGQYIRMVISFADDLPTDKADQIANEFFILFMGGHRDDEYHLDIVRHDDTEYTHYHSRIPKLNLYTGNQLKIYNHKTDLSRVNAIRDYLVKKYELIHPDDQRKLIKQPQKEQLERVSAWRKEHSQPELVLKTKKGRIAAKEALDNYVQELIQFGEIGSFEDLKKEIEEIAPVVNEGYEKAKKVPFLTIRQDDKKLKLEGEIYGRSFYENTKEDRSKAVRENKPIRKSKALDHVTLDKLKRRVITAQGKRKKFLDRAYAAARARAAAAAAEIEAESVPQTATTEEIELFRKIMTPPERTENDTIREQIDRDAAGAESGSIELIKESRRRIESSERRTEVTNARSAAVAVLTDENTRGIGEQRRRREQRKSVREGLVSVLVGATDKIGGIIQGIFEAIKPAAVVADSISSEEEYQAPEIRSVLDDAEFPVGSGIKSIL